MKIQKCFLHEALISPKSENSFVVFEMCNHLPDNEAGIQRLEVLRATGLDYTIPQYSIAGLCMVVGNYQYAQCYSLEGPYVTSKEIVSNPWRIKPQTATESVQEKRSRMSHQAII